MLSDLTYRFFARTGCNVASSGPMRICVIRDP